MSRSGREARLGIFLRRMKKLNIKVNKKNLTLKITYSALCLALCMVLPLLTGQIPQIGSMLCPMHILVFLCGFLCGMPYGALIGFVAPLLRFAIFGMPPIYPTGLAMAFELAAYGFFSGLFFKLFPKKFPFLYPSLILSMLIGRGIWGLARFFMASVDTKVFTLKMFLSGAFTTAFPGIILHIVLVPLIVLALMKAHLVPAIKDDRKKQKPAEKAEGTPAEEPKKA